MQDVDEGLLGTVTALLWERGRLAVTSIEVRQRPHESYACVSRKSGKQHNDSNLNFTDVWWEKATPVDWPPQVKQEYLLSVWDDVLQAIDASWGAEATQAASA